MRSIIGRGGRKNDNKDCKEMRKMRAGMEDKNGTEVEQRRVRLYWRQRKWGRLKLEEEMSI